VRLCAVVLGERIASSFRAAIEETGHRPPGRGPGLEVLLPFRSRPVGEKADKHASPP